MNRSNIRDTRNLPQAKVWKATYILGPIPCDLCGKVIHKDMCWQRSAPHKILGEYRCQGCPPGLADKAERRGVKVW